MKREEGGGQRDRVNQRRDRERERTLAGIRGPSRQGDTGNKKRRERQTQTERWKGD